jgi:hypothetical protein
MADIITEVETSQLFKDLVQAQDITEEQLAAEIKVRLENAIAMGSGRENKMPRLIPYNKNGKELNLIEYQALVKQHINDIEALANELHLMATEDKNTGFAWGELTAINTQVAGSLTGGGSEGAKYRRTIKRLSGPAEKRLIVINSYTNLGSIGEATLASIALKAHSDNFDSIVTREIKDPAQLEQMRLRTGKYEGGANIPDPVKDYMFTVSPGVGSIIAVEFVDLTTPSSQDNHKALVLMYVNTRAGQARDYITEVIVNRAEVYFWEVIGGPNLALNIEHSVSDVSRYPKEYVASIKEFLTKVEAYAEAVKDTAQESIAKKVIANLKNPYI